MDRPALSVQTPSGGMRTALSDGSIQSATSVFAIESLAHVYAADVGVSLQNETVIRGDVGV